MPRAKRAELDGRPAVKMGHNWMSRTATLHSSARDRFAQCSSSRGPRGEALRAPGNYVTFRMGKPGFMGIETVQLSLKTEGRALSST